MEMEGVRSVGGPCRPVPWSWRGVARNAWTMAGRDGLVGMGELRATPLQASSQSMIAGSGVALAGRLFAVLQRLGR